VRRGNWPSLLQLTCKIEAYEPGGGKGFRVLTSLLELVKSLFPAEVAKLADALRSGRSGHYARVGSNPTFGTQP
jgi:hypothetical protein